MAYLRANAFSPFFFFAVALLSYLLVCTMYVQLKAQSLLYNHHHKLELTFFETVFQSTNQGQTIMFPFGQRKRLFNLNIFILRYCKKELNIIK